MVNSRYYEPKYNRRMPLHQRKKILAEQRASKENAAKQKLADEENFRNNPYLKKKGIPVEWTPELISEYMKCMEDPIYFIEHYIKIETLDHGVVNFEMYPYQKQIINLIHNKKNTIITCARQSGKSTTVAGYLCWYAIFHEHKRIAILANKLETAQEILRRVKLSYESLPNWLQQGILKWNEKSINIENGSFIKASATSPSAIRGQTYNIIMVDEAAHIDNWEPFYASVRPTISSGKKTKMILISTPNGMNHFYELYDGAVRGLNDFGHKEVDWTQVPGRTELWAKKELAALNFDQDKFDQEYNNQFLGSSGTLISGSSLKRLMEKIKTPLHSDENFSIFEHPIDFNKYMISVDVSRGKGLDYSAFHVIDCTRLPFRQVARFKSNEIMPADYAALIHQIAKRYNYAHILVEINDIGEQVSYMIKNDFEYENVIATMANGRGGRKAGIYTYGADYGTRTTKTTKSKGCALLKILVEQEQLLIPDRETIIELTTFSKKGDNNYQAEEGKYDDMAMGLVIFSWLSNEEYFKDIIDVDALGAIRENSDDNINIVLEGFAFIDVGEEIIEIGTKNAKYASWLGYENSNPQTPEEQWYAEYDDFEKQFNKWLRGGNPFVEL